jgi:hypothetical protein
MRNHLNKIQGIVADEGTKLHVSECEIRGS